MKTCLYVIEAGIEGPIKIGVAANVERRRQGLQGGSPYPLKILARIPYESKEAAVAMERKAHRRLKRWALQGEWFEHDAWPWLLANGIE